PGVFAAATASAIGQTIGATAFFSPPESTLGARPGSVLPFRLSGQAIAGTGLLTEPFGIGLGILPTDIDNRTIIPAPAVVWRSGPVSGTGEFFVIGKGDFELADAKGLRDAHLPFGHGVT